jgi:predicted outer membrane lipoprotein
VVFFLGSRPGFAVTLSVLNAMWLEARIVRDEDRKGP